MVYINTLSDWQLAIDSIIGLKQAFTKIDQKIPRSILSLYGKLTVVAELRNRFPDLSLEFKHRRFKSDIVLITEDGLQTFIETKTSRYLRKEFGEGYEFEFNVRKCTKHPTAYVQRQKLGRLEGDLCYFDSLVCVCLQEDLVPWRYYMFTRDELIMNLQRDPSGFGSAPYRIVIPVEPKFEQVTPFYEHIYNHPDSYVNRWDKLEKASRDLFVSDELLESQQPGISWSAKEKKFLEAVSEEVYINDPKRKRRVQALSKPGPTIEDVIIQTWSSDLLEGR